MMKPAAYSSALKVRLWTAAVRQIAAHADAVYVFTGPIFASATTELIGDGDRQTMYAAQGTS